MKIAFVREMLGLVMLVMAIGLCASPAQARLFRVILRAPPPPALVKECVAKFTKDAPHVKFVGKFFLVAPADTLVTDISKLISPGDMIAVAAPSAHTNLLGLNYRGYAGCAYEIKDGKLLFKGLEHPNGFPRRFVREPGEQ